MSFHKIFIRSPRVNVVVIRKSDPIKLARGFSFNDLHDLDENFCKRGSMSSRCDRRFAKEEDSLDLSLARHQLVVDKVQLDILLVFGVCDQMAEEVRDKMSANVRKCHDERDAVVDNNARASFALDADKFTWPMPSVFIFPVGLSIDIADRSWKKEFLLMSMLFHLLRSCQSIFHDTLQAALFGK